MHYQNSVSFHSEWSQKEEGDGRVKTVLWSSPFIVVFLRLQRDLCADFNLIDYNIIDFPGDSGSLIQLPVYLNSSRANLLFTVSIMSILLIIIAIITRFNLQVNLPLAAGQKKTDFHERGVAIIASTALNW